MPDELRAIGLVEPYSTIQVKSQIAGELQSVNFTEGSMVNRNDLLFVIDPRPYQESLRQAEAAVTKDTAQLSQAQANLARDQAQLKNAERDAARYEKLASEGVIARQQSDQFRTNAEVLQETIKADQAAIESNRAALESDRAAVGAAKLNLSYCEIRSPISGRAGNLLVNAGNLVKSNDTSMVVINQVSPIFVSFGVPQRQLPAVRQKSSAGKLPVQVTLESNPGQVVRGMLTVIDNTVDTNTGTIKLKATFANEEHLLWPGQFVNVLLLLDTRNDAVAVPSEAIQAGQHGQFVYVVKPDQSVEMRPVTVGQTVGGKVVVEKGVAAGETVVTDGQLRLVPGARVRPVPAGKVDSQTF